MKEMVIILGLLAGAYAFSATVSPRERRRFGFLGGSEWFVLGVVVGPEALAFISRRFMHEVGPAIVAVCAWLAFLHGLRARRSRVTGLFGVWKLAAEPLLTAVIAYTGSILFLGGTDQDTRALRLWALMAASSVTSALLWLGNRAGGEGRDAELRMKANIGGTLTLVLVPLVLVTRETLWMTLGGMLLPLLFALLVTLLIGRGRFDEDFIWVAIIGFLSLGAGLGMHAGLPVIGVAASMGIGLGWFFADADAIDHMLARTEKPLTVMLFFLLGTQLVFDVSVLLVATALVFIRLVAKVAAGAIVFRGRSLGVALVGAGEAAALIAASVMLEPGSSQTLVAAFGLSLVTGDVLTALEMHA